MECAVRVAREADEPALRSFLRKQRASFQSALLCDPDVDLNCLEAHYNNRDGFILMVESNGTLLGTIGLFPLESGRCEIRKFYLTKPITGAGLGEQLLQTVLRQARLRGFHTVQLETLPSWVDAYSLYARAGFRPAPSIKAESIVGGRVLELALASEGEAEQAC